MNDDPESEGNIEPTDSDIISSSSSSSNGTGTFEPQTPLVLELHDITKDDNPKEDSPPDSRKKIRRKKRPVKKISSSSFSSDSLSESDSLTIPSLATEIKEQFYDAHESYHGISGSDKGPVITTARLQAHSDPLQHQKGSAPTVTVTEDQSTTSTSCKDSSAANSVETYPADVICLLVENYRAKKSRGKSS